jgi:hypothetical protein
MQIPGLASPETALPAHTCAFAAPEHLKNLAGIFHDVDGSVKNFHETFSPFATVSTEC